MGVQTVEDDDDNDDEDVGDGVRVVSSFTVENSIIVELLCDDDNSAFFGAILHTDEGCTPPTVVVNASTEDTRSIKVNDIISS